MSCEVRGHNVTFKGPPLFCSARMSFFVYCLGSRLTLGVYIPLYFQDNGSENENAKRERRFVGEEE